MEKVIEIKNLTKKFKKVLAVDDLSFEVYRGDVFGFLGPNGAGKSTTIRMMLSLIFPTGGDIEILGKPLLKYRTQILRKIGAIVEKPDFYKYLTAIKNLEIFGRISGCDTSKKKLMEMLELVGLEKRAHSKVKTYSHGMKQRLGIAQALLHDPELIILDEPTTGLDPQGMKEIRDLIIKLSHDKKKTILLSSHLLHEVQLVANRMLIINKGKKIIEGSVNELIQSRRHKVKFEVDDPGKARKYLEGIGLSYSISDQNGSDIVISLDSEDVPGINKALVENGIGVKAIIPGINLENLFLELTGKGGE